jgi:hypothetical protein
MSGRPSGCRGSLDTVKPFEKLGGRYPKLATTPDHLPISVAHEAAPRMQAGHRIEHIALANG